MATSEKLSDCFLDRMLGFTRTVLGYSEYDKNYVQKATIKLTLVRAFLEFIERYEKTEYPEVEELIMINLLRLRNIETKKAVKGNSGNKENCTTEVHVCDKENSKTCDNDKFKEKNKKK